MEEEWKQKYMELLNQTKVQDEKIENLTQEKDKYCKMTNGLSSELAKTRRLLLEASQSIELDKIRLEMANVQLESSKLKSDAENKDQEIQKLRKEMESLKNNSKAMKAKIK